MPIDAGRQALSIMDRFLEPESPGLVYLVVNAQGPVFERAIGLADILRSVPLTPATTMAAFSMTKTLTALAVLQLAERKALRLDDKASRFVSHPYDPDLTIRHLIAHTSGAPNPIPLRWVHAEERHAGFDERAALSSVLTDNARQKSRPGDRYRYSNIGYWLLGQVIENAARKPYSAYLKESLFEPLGLGPGDIGFSISSPDAHAKGYLAARSVMNLLKGLLLDRGTWGGYEGKWLRIRDIHVNGPAFGGAIGSAASFGAILRDLLKPRSVLLSPESKALLYERARLNSGRSIRMTMGWHVGELAGRPYYFKEGGGAGFHCEMRTYPERGLASVIMVNRTSFSSNSILSRLDRGFLGG